MIITVVKDKVIVDGEGDFLLSPKGIKVVNGTFTVKNFRGAMPITNKKFILKCVKDWLNGE